MSLRSRKSRSDLVFIGYGHRYLVKLRSSYYGGSRLASEEVGSDSIGSDINSLKLSSPSADWLELRDIRFGGSWRRHCTDPPIKRLEVLLRLWLYPLKLRATQKVWGTPENEYG
ncbi:hypothetical protein BBP40_010013 [Aspergillus hancockii]|nr:hypothetical protein BBP40_010013 [Aspergillus hancockii]